MCKLVAVLSTFAMIATIIVLQFQSSTMELNVRATYGRWHKYRNTYERIFIEGDI